MPSDGRVSLVGELCRVLHSNERAMLCAMSHGQVRVSGHLVYPRHDMCWTKEQLKGRMAELCDSGDGDPNPPRNSSGLLEPHVAFRCGRL